MSAISQLLDDDFNKFKDEHQQTLKEIAANRQEMKQTTENMLAMAAAAEEHLSSITTDWAQQWADLGLAFDETGERVEVVTNLKNKLGYDVALLGPELKEKDDTEKVEREICALMLRRDQDFTDAIIHVGRDDFFGEHLENAHRNTSLVAAVAASAYTVMRDMFLSLGEDIACKNVHHYRNMIRSVRSLCYLTKIGRDNLLGVEEKIAHLEVLKDKYDATIFTLRRQLQDFHRQEGTVGRGMNGEYQTFAPVTSPGAPATPGAASGAAAVVDKNVIVIVQLESINHLRGRHQQLYDASSAVCKNIITSFANAFDLRRTNFTESGNSTKISPVSYMFIGDEAYQALSFATELHVELNSSPDWPAPLLQMTKYSSSEAWRGLRVRIGIHYGTINEMDVPETTAVMHAEGVQVEKCMRITSLGGAGDTIVSTALWAEYKSELTKNIVPTNKRYQSLRLMKQQELPCGLRRGFKKGEICFKQWHTHLSDREMSPIETDFEVVSFFGLEAGTRGDGADDEPPSFEELLFAKDTELAMVQQELDSLRLAVIKRDNDMETLKAQLLSSLEQVRRRTQNKVFYHECLASSLESQLLDRENALGQCDDVLQQLLRAQAKRHSTKPTPLTTLTDAEDGGEAAAGLDGTNVFSHEEDGTTLTSPSGSDDDDDDGDTAAASSTTSSTSSKPNDTPLKTKASSHRKRNTKKHSSKNLLSPGGHVVVSNPDTMEDLDENRRKKFHQWTAEQDGNANPHSYNVESPDKDMKHKNITLWRQLNNLVKDAGMKVVQAPVAFGEPSKKNNGPSSGGGNAVSPQGLKRIQSAIRQGSLPHVARLHSIVRIFTMLTKRFIANEDLENDSDNQSISEEQFIYLFMKLIHPEGVPGNQREYIQLVANSAVDNETVEAASQHDDNKMIRSSVGHLSRIFLWLRQFKRKTILEANTLRKMADEMLAREKQQDKKKGGGGGAAATSSLTATNNPAMSRLLNASNVMAKGTSVGAKRTPGVTPSTSPQSTALDAPSSLTPRPKEDTETARMKEELQSLRNEVNKLKSQQQRAQQAQSVAATKIARAKAEDNKMNSSVLSSSGGGNLQVPGVVNTDSSMNSNGPPLSPATLSLVAEAEAFVLSDARPEAGPRPPNENSAGTDNSSFGLDGSPFMFKPRPSSTPPYMPLSNEGAQDPDPEDDASPRDPNTHLSPAMHQRPAAGGTRSGGAVMSPVSASSPKAGLSLTVQGISPSSQQAANNGSSAYTGGGMYSASPYNNNTYPTGVTAESAAKAVALAAAKAHRVGTPFNADVGLRVGGSGIAATASSQAGLYATDNRVVQLGGVDSLQQYRPHNKGPVLQPLRRPGAQPVPIGVARAVTPPPLQGMPQGQSLMPPRQQHDGQQHMMMADGARPRTVAIPAGMSAPQENNGVPKDGKLYFALNAQDVQRQLQQDAEDRKRLEEHQNRIQEQLLHLRQLQHENEALMGRATPSSGMRAKMSGGRMQPQGNQGAGIPMGITRLATPNNSVGSAAVISPNKNGPVAPTMVVNSSAPPSGMQLHHALESAAAITVPTQEGKKSQLVANIVAQHRR